MLDIKYIREHVDEVKENAQKRGVSVAVDRLVALDEQRRETMAKIQELQAVRNQTSKTKPSDEEIQKMRGVGEEIRSLETVYGDIEAEYKALLFAVPNKTHPDVPTGDEAASNERATAGTVPAFRFEAKDHEQLLTDLGLIDFDRGAKVTGSQFFFAQGDLVRLNQALLSYAIDIVTKRGYTLMETPDLAKDEILAGIGFNPRGPEAQVYSIENSDLSLIGTAEITLGGYHANEIIDLSDGPKKYVALSHCFRTEAGAYGRTSKGLYRVHQFTKLEMFIYCKPEESEQLHEELLEIERDIADGLNIPYRVIDVASGDLGGSAYRKYDIEAWMVMKDGYGEITSTSNCTDYQARRLGIRYRTPEGETALVHTLNGTAMNSSRWPIAILETYQQADGSIRVPKVLQSYMGGQRMIGRTAAPSFFQGFLNLFRNTKK